jgi:hypothetical protein
MTPEELNNKDITIVVESVWHIAAVLMNDGERKLEENDREYLIDTMDQLTTMLARWYHIR